MFNVFFTDNTGKADYEIVFGRGRAAERANYYKKIGYTNIRIGRQ